MEKEIYILFTAGRGPVECALAVQGVQKKFKDYLKNKNIACEIVNQKKGALNKTLETIVFKIGTPDNEIVKPWLGTIQWICQSPIRKFHKRKNWFIKCEKMEAPKSLEVNAKDVLVQSFRASGPGGQHRNKVETAIRIIHKTSGIIVTASDGKSQVQNKKKAWERLNAKLLSENNRMLKEHDSDQWINQIEIERGRPIKTFKGSNFRE